MAHQYTYFVQRLQVLPKSKPVWRIVIGSHGIKSYALGWFHALTSFLPRPAYRIVKYDPSIPLSKTTVIEESEAAGLPSP